MGWSAERLSSLASTKSHKLFCVGADSVYDGMACFLDSKQDYTHSRTSSGVKRL